jgi:hypothetical protein
MTETIFDAEDRSPETVEAAERRVYFLIARRDAAWTVIMASRAGPNLPTDVYIMFKIIHGNAEGDLVEARRQFTRAATIYREVKRQEWMAINAAKPKGNLSIPALNALYLDIDALDNRIMAIAKTATEREWIDAQEERDALEHYWSGRRINWDKRMAMRVAGRKPPTKRGPRRTILVDGVRTKLENA